MGNPKLKARRSIPLNPSFRGKREAISVYPGKKRMKGRLKTICNQAKEETDNIGTKMIVRILIIRRSFTTTPVLPDLFNISLI